MIKQSRKCISAKNLITSATALQYHDAAIPMTFQVDISEDAINGVLLQNDQPVRFTSHTLNSTEKNYAQIEKECLAIVFCIDKWLVPLWQERHNGSHRSPATRDNFQQCPPQVAKDDANIAKISFHSQAQERKRAFCCRRFVPRSLCLS